MSTSGSSAIVVGGGIVGAACAMYLCEAGFAVTIVDAAYPGAGATGAGMGHLVVMDDSEAQLALTAYSLELWRELFAELPPSCEVTHCGTLWVAGDDVEMAAVMRKHELYSRAGIRSEILDNRQLAEAEPSLVPGMVGALRVADDAVVYPPGAALALLGRAASHGARLCKGWRATRLESGTVHSDRGVLHADVIVNAAGNGAGLLSPDAEVRPRRGHLAITDRYPGMVRHQIVELGYLKSAHEMTGESIAFNVQPRSTGQLLIGSSRELGRSDPAVNGRLLARMLARATQFIPALSSLSVTRVWTGIRPTSADKLPFVGRSTTAESVWIAAGHEGLGITTSLASGKLLADMICGRTTAIDAEPFRPGRASAAWS